MTCRQHCHPGRKARCNKKNPRISIEAKQLPNLRNRITIVVPSDVEAEIQVKTAVRPDPVGVTNELITALFGPCWPGRQISLRDARELLADQEDGANSIIESAAGADDGDQGDGGQGNGSGIPSDNNPQGCGPAEGGSRMCQYQSYREAFLGAYLAEDEWCFQHDFEDSLFDDELDEDVPFDDRGPEHWEYEINDYIEDLLR